MNKKGQSVDFEELIKLIILLPILLVMFGAIFGVISTLNQDNCPTCDCSQYQNQITNLTEQLEICKNQTKEIVYVNQTVEVPVDVIKEVPVYKDTIPTKIIISLSILLSIILTFYLFKIEIDLPEEIKEKIKKIDKWIIRVKWISLVITVILLLWGLIKLFIFIKNLF